MRSILTDRFAVRSALPVRPLRCEIAGAMRRVGQLVSWGWR